MSEEKKRLSGLADLSKLSGWPIRSLQRMNEKHPVRFETILLGCKAKAQQALDKEIGE